MVYEFLKQYPYTTYVITTKIDKVNKTLQNGTLKKIKDVLQTEDIYPFSSLSKVGVKEILSLIDETIN